MESWQNINQEFQLAEMFGPPYAFCGRFCVSIVRSWKERRRISAPVEYYFENGAKHKGELINRLKKHDGIIAKFAGKESAQLQAADLIAWKNRRVVHDIINRPDSMMGDNLRRSLAPVSRVPGNSTCLMKRNYWPSVNGTMFPPRNEESWLRSGANADPQSP